MNDGTRPESYPPSAPATMSGAAGSGSRVDEHLVAAGLAAQPGR
jgi:hypothetical protein